jgi:hypothetical protein
MKYNEISKFEQEAIRTFMARDPKEIKIKLMCGTEKFLHFGYEEV